MKDVSPFKLEEKHKQHSLTIRGTEHDPSSSAINVVFSLSKHDVLAAQVAYYDEKPNEKTRWQSFFLLETSAQFK